MNALPVFEKAEAYLSVHMTHSGPGGTARPPGPFITISRESGAGGTSLARALVERLEPDDEGHPWMIYSGNLIEEVLRTNDLPARLARFMPEDHISELDASVGEIVGLHPNLWNLVEKTNELIRRLARAGHAILLGRGANFATVGIGGGVHLRLVAPPAFRAERTAHWLSIDPSAAAAHNSRRDAARSRYVRSTFDTDVTNPSAYDLVINTATVPVTTAAEIVTGFVRAHTQSANRTAS